MPLRFALVLLVACSRPHGPAAPDEPAAPVPITREARCPGVRAVWSGERTGDHERFAALTLVVAGAPKPWTLDLEDIPSGNWSFDIFSPDCRHVLLLQSRLGPFHVVRTDHLARYVAGGPPDHELTGVPDPRGLTGMGNDRDGRWDSNTEISYAWGCCDPPVVSRFVLPPGD